MEAIASGRVLWAWSFSLAAAIVANVVIGSPVSSGLIALGWVAVPSALYVLSDRFTAAGGMRRMVLQETYDKNQRQRNNVVDAYTSVELRDSLDEAGQAAFDMLEDAIERRRSA